MSVNLPALLHFSERLEYQALAAIIHTCLQLVSHPDEAIIKAMLNSPSADHVGYSTLFGHEFV